MAQHKLGALLRSVPPATARTEAWTTASAPPPLEPTPLALAPARFNVRSDRAGSATSLRVLIPQHIRTQLGVKAAEERRSLRELVLRAIRGLGIDVSDEDIRGKRGRKGI